jgi:predicted nucleotidyltransferase
MRLTPRQHALLRQAARTRFGPGSRLWLFGSRVDDRRRGGDFDLLVQTDLADAASLVEARLAFLADLHATPDFEGEKIDVVLLAPALGPARQPIHEVALATGVEL